MAERPIWRGNLRLALVSCPIALYGVRQPGETLHFHFINPETGHRVRMVTQDAETDEELSRRDLKRRLRVREGQVRAARGRGFRACPGSTARPC